MPEPVDPGDVTTFHGGGRVTGVAALVLVAAALIFGVASPRAGYADWAWPALGLLAVVVWCVMLRPRVRLTADVLELRNAVSTAYVALVAVDDVEVRQVLRVRVAGRLLTCAGAGRSHRARARDARAAAHPEHDYSEAALLEQRVRSRSAELRVLHAHADQPVRRTWAWPEIAALVVAVVATVVGVAI